MSDIILRFPTSVVIEGTQQIQADWTQGNTAALDFIKNKPENLVQDANYEHIDNNYTNAEKQAVATISDKVDKVAGKGLSTNDFDNTYKSYVDRNIPLTGLTLDTEINLSTNYPVYYLEKSINTAYTPTISASPIIGAAARVVLNAGASASLVATNLGTKMPESSDFTVSKLNELIVYSLPEGIAYTIAILN